MDYPMVEMQKVFILLYINGKEIYPKGIYSDREGAKRVQKFYEGIDGDCYSLWECSIDNELKYPNRIIVDYENKINEIKQYIKEN